MMICDTVPFGWICYEDTAIPQDCVLITVYNDAVVFHTAFIDFSFLPVNVDLLEAAVACYFMLLNVFKRTCKSDK